MSMKQLITEMVDTYLQEAKQSYIVIDTADNNNVVGTASDEAGAKSIIAGSRLPPMSIKDKTTLKIVKSKIKQHIGYNLKESDMNEVLVKHAEDAHDVKKKATALKAKMVKLQNTQGGDSHMKLLAAKKTFDGYIAKLKTYGVDPYEIKKLQE